MIDTPYLLFLGDAPDKLSAKVAQGIKDWRPEHAIGQFRLPECKVDLGLADLSIQEAVDKGVKTLVIGVANRGGVISPEWKDTLIEALEAGLDIASGLHNLLRNEFELVEKAKSLGRQLHDVRIPSVQYPIATGIKRSGKRLLAVGTDCSVGKMYTALSIEQAMRARDAKATFRATGQTGILITGEGVPLDAVVADFMAGSIEYLTPDNDDDHWDIVEGQGSIFHASFSGVTMALIHGSQPDALILSHEPNREHMRGLPDYQLPTLEKLRDTVLPLAQIVNPNCQVVGIALNTSAMPEDAASMYCAQIEEKMGLPTVDPYRHGADRLAEAVMAH